jgi:hypothetical protein
MSQAGRPRVLDDVKRGQLVALATAGCSLNAAARFVGCSVDTIRREALRNEDFRRELRGAEIRSQLAPLQAMRSAAQSHWRAAAWLLERADPEKFDRRRPADCRPQQMHDAVDAAVAAAVDEIADPELRDRVARRMLIAAYRSSRSLVAEQRSRIDPSWGSFTSPKASEGDDLAQLLAELNRGHDFAAQTLKREKQNPKNCA